MDASSNLHVGEKSPDLAMKSGLDVSSRVRQKLHQPLKTALSISPSGTDADVLIAAMSTTFCVDGETLSRNVVQSLS